MENGSIGPIKESRKFTVPKDTWKGLGIALLLFAVAYYFHYTMTCYESGEGISMNRLLLVAYKLLGKNLTTGLLGLIGVVALYISINDLIKANKV